MALTRVLQGGLLGAACGMGVAYLTRSSTATTATLPFQVPEVEQNNEAMALCLSLGDFRDYSNEGFVSICKNLNKILLYEKLVNDTTVPIDAGISKKAHVHIFDTKQWLAKLPIPPTKQGLYEDVRKSIETFVEEKKHNIELGVSSRLSDEY